MTLIACYLCVWVYIYIYYSYWLWCQGFPCFCFCGISGDFCHTSWVCPNDLFDFVQLRKHSVCLHFVLVLFRVAWIGRGFDWFKKKKRKKQPLSIKLSNTLNSIMWLILLVLHWVHHTLWAMFYESFAVFNTTEHWGSNLWFQRMDLMPRKPSKAPQLLILNDFGAADACSGFNAVWINSSWVTFWILMWSQRSETFSPGLVLWRLTETVFCWG